MKKYFIWWKTQYAGPDKCWTVISCAKYHFVTFVDKKVLQNKNKKRAKLTLTGDHNEDHNGLSPF